MCRTVQNIKLVGDLRFVSCVSDSTGNTLKSRTIIHQKIETIIPFPDCCHELHNTAKDICKLQYWTDVSMS